MFKIKHHVTTEVDLRDVPYVLWPPAAKQFAWLTVNHRRKEFDRQLFKKDWLVGQVEQHQKNLEEWEEQMEHEFPRLAK